MLKFTAKSFNTLLQANPPFLKAPLLKCSSPKHASIPYGPHHPHHIQSPCNFQSGFLLLSLLSASFKLPVSTITSLYSLDSCLFPSTAHFCIPCDTHLQLCHLPPSLPHITFRSNHQTHSLPQSTYSICTLILPDLPPLRHHLLAPIPPQPDHQPSLYPLPNQPQSPKTSL